MADEFVEISKEDIRIVLSYVSLSQDIHNYKDRVNSQEELHSIIETCFVWWRKNGISRI